MGYGSVAELCLVYTQYTEPLVPPSALWGRGKFPPITTLAIHSGVYHHTPQCISGSPRPSVLPPQGNHSCPAYTHLPAMCLWFPSSNPVPSLVASDCFLFQSRGWACPRCTGFAVVIATLCSSNSNCFPMVEIITAADMRPHSSGYFI